jgi:transposase
VEFSALDKGGGGAQPAQGSDLYEVHKGPMTIFNKDWQEEGKGITAAVYTERVLPRVYHFLRNVERLERATLSKRVNLDQFNIKDTNCTLMEDGASIHTAKLTKSAHAERGVDRTWWPANSPDLNPIENLWRKLKYRVGRRFPRNEIQCRCYLKEEWDRLNVEDFQHYIKSMPERIQAVIDAKGGHTKW